MFERYSVSNLYENFNRLERGIINLKFSFEKLRNHIEISIRSAENEWTFKYIKIPMAKTEFSRNKIMFSRLYYH